MEKSDLTSLGLGELPRKIKTEKSNEETMGRKGREFEREKVRRKR